MGNLLFGRSSKSFSSFSHSFQTLLYHHWGPKAADGPHSSWSDFTHPAFFSLPFAFFLVWTALVHTSHTASFSHCLFHAHLHSLFKVKKQKKCPCRLSRLVCNRLCFFLQVTCVVSSLARSSRRSRSRGNFFTIAQIFVHMRQVASGFVGKRSKVQVESVLKEKVRVTE